MLYHFIVVGLLELIDVVDTLLNLVLVDLQVSGFQLEAFDVVPVLAIEVVVVEDEAQPGSRLIDLLLAAAAGAPVGGRVSGLDVLQRVAEVVHLHS